MSKNRNPTTRKDTSTKAKFAKKEKKTLEREGVYEGIYYESYTELYALYWMLELKKAGYISKIERSTPFLLCDSIKNDYVVTLKRSSRPMNQTLMQGHSYTPDYNVTFTEKALNIFIWDINSDIKWDKSMLICHKIDKGSYLCHIEVKPSIDWRGKTAKAINDIKWVFQKFQIFINILKPEEIFKRTFTPNEYIHTFTGKPRKLKYEPISLARFLFS